MSIEIEIDQSGRKAVLFGSWTSKDGHEIRRQGVRRLVIRGFVGDDLDFLGELPELESLDVDDLHVKNVSGISRQPHLRRLTVDAYYTAPVDLSGLPELEEVHLEWGRGAESLIGSPRLQRLSLNHYPGRDLLDLGGDLGSVREFRIAGAGRLESLAGIERLHSLQGLRLLALRRLSTLDGIESLASTLTDLELDTCRRVHDLRPIGSLMCLKVLGVLNCDDIDSLLPLEGLTELERFYFYESTKVADGDLSVLLRLPKLRDTSFANRRGYSHTREQIAEFLERAVRSGNSTR